MLPPALAACSSVPFPLAPQLSPRTPTPVPRQPSLCGFLLSIYKQWFPISSEGRCGGRTLLAFAAPRALRPRAVSGPGLAAVCLRTHRLRLPPAPAPGQRHPRVGRDPCLLLPSPREQEQFRCRLRASPHHTLTLPRRTLVFSLETSLGSGAWLPVRIPDSPPGPALFTLSLLPLNPSLGRSRSHPCGSS